MEKLDAYNHSERISGEFDDITDGITPEPVWVEKFKSTATRKELYIFFKPFESSETRSIALDNGTLTCYMPLPEVLPDSIIFTDADGSQSSSVCHEHCPTNGGCGDGACIVTLNAENTPKFLEVDYCGDGVCAVTGGESGTKTCCGPACSPPALAIIGNKTVNEGQPLSFSVSATDTDSLTLTYAISAAGLPSAASFSGQTFNWVPDYSQAGSYGVTFTVSDGVFLDSEAITITVVDVPVPDLTTNSLSTIATAVAPGNKFTLSNTVMNQGTAPSGAFTVAFSLSTDASYGGVDDIAFSNTRSVTGLSVGANSSASTSLTVPATTPLGSYYVCARADSGNTVTEADEANNGRCTTSAIQISWPDLVMTKISGPANAVRGTVVSLANTVKNQGVSSAIGFFVGFYLSTDAAITASDIYLGRRWVGSLAAGQSSSAATNMRIPISILTGTYYIGGIADYNNRAQEINETNNALEGNTLVVQ
jgi:hypothetical protein